MFNDNFHWQKKRRKSWKTNFLEEKTEDKCCVIFLHWRCRLDIPENEKTISIRLALLFQRPGIFFSFSGLEFLQRLCLSKIIGLEKFSFDQVSTNSTSFFLLPVWTNDTKVEFPLLWNESIWEFRRATDFVGDCSIDCCFVDLERNEFLDVTFCSRVRKRNEPFVWIRETARKIPVLKRREKRLQLAKRREDRRSFEVKPGWYHDIMLSPNEKTRKWWATTNFSSATRRDRHKERKRRKYIVLKRQTRSELILHHLLLFLSFFFVVRRILFD